MEARFPLLVRTPDASRENIGRVLDAGADGIIVPMVNTPETAADAVRYAKYQPVGDRGVSVTRAHSGYGVADLAQYLAQANERVQVWVQIETVTALERIEEIAQTPGLTGLILGPNDFMQSVGASGDLLHPRLDEAIEVIGATAKKRGLQAAVISSNAHLLQRSQNAGFDVLVMDSELGHLIKGGRAALASLETALQGE